MYHVCPIIGTIHAVSSCEVKIIASNDLHDGHSIEGVAYVDCPIVGT
jgi:hypothetical protein